MKRLVFLLVASSASAAPITPPAGWTLDPALAAPPAAQRFGGATTKVAVYAYRAPTPGAVLYVNRAEAEVAAAERDRVATLELEEPRNALRRQGANAKAEEDTQRFDAAAQQLEAAVTWRDATSRRTASDSGSENGPAPRKSGASSKELAPVERMPSTG